jgi:hypothetical protein
MVGANMHVGNKYNTAQLAKSRAIHRNFGPVVEGCGATSAQGKQWP